MSIFTLTLSVRDQRKTFQHATIWVEKELLTLASASGSKQCAVRGKSDLVLTKLIVVSTNR